MRKNGRCCNHRSRKLGIALAKVLHTNGNKVTVWSIVEDEITMLKEKHEHVQKLPG